MSNLLSIIHLGPASSPENDWKTANAGRIHEVAFKVCIIQTTLRDVPSNRRHYVSVGVFFSIAAISVLLRTATRLWTRRRLYLDDVLLLWALICLSAATGIGYHILALNFLEEAIAVEPTVVVPISQLGNLMGSLAYTDAFLCLIWTCTFSVKFSFLALFRLLIKRVSKHLTRYFWFVVVYMVLTWMFLVVEPFILCPYQGLDQSEHFTTLVFHQ